MSPKNHSRLAALRSRTPEEFSTLCDTRFSAIGGGMFLCFLIEVLPTSPSEATLQVVQAERKSLDCVQVKGSYLRAASLQGADSDWMACEWCSPAQKLTLTRPRPSKRAQVAVPEDVGLTVAVGDATLEQSATIEGVAEGPARAAADEEAEQQHAHLMTQEQPAFEPQQPTQLQEPPLVPQHPPQSPDAQEHHGAGPVPIAERGEETQEAAEAEGGEAGARG